MALSDRFKKFNNSVEVNEIKLTDNNSQPLVCSGDIIPQIIKSLSVKISQIPVWSEYSDEKKRELVLNFINAKLAKDFNGVEVDYIEKEKVISRFLNTVYGFGLLDDLLLRADISSVFVKCSDVYYDSGSGFVKSDIRIDKKQLEPLLKHLPQTCNSSVVTARVSDFIITAVYHPVSENGVNIFIKKTGREFCFDNELKQMFEKMIREGKNLLVAGRINSGKTSFINSLINLGGKSVILEDYFQVCAKSDDVKYELASINSKYDFDMLLANVLKLNSDNFYADTNNPLYFGSILENINADTKGFCSSIRANSADSGISKVLLGIMAAEKVTEKLAKVKFSSVFDYVIYIDNMKVSSVVEISSTKTLSLTQNIIYGTDI